MTCFMIGKAAPLNRCQLALLTQSIFFDILRFCDVLVGNGLAVIEMGNDNCLIDNVFDTDRSILNQAL